MKTYNVRSKQWRKHYRKICRLDSRAFREHFEYLQSNPGMPSSKCGARIIISAGIISHNNKMLMNGRQFWIPINP